MSSPIVPSLDTVDQTITFMAGPDAPNVIQIRINITDDLVALEATESYVTSLQILRSPANIEIGQHLTTLVDVLDNDRKFPCEMSTSNHAEPQFKCFCRIHMTRQETLYC